MTKEQLKQEIEATLQSPVMPPLTGDGLATLLKLMVDEMGNGSSGSGGTGGGSPTEGEWEGVAQLANSSLEIVEPLEAKVGALGNNGAATVFLKGQFFVQPDVIADTLLIGRLPEFALPRRRQVFPIGGHPVSVHLFIHENGDVELKAESDLPVKTPGSNPYAVNVFFRPIIPPVKAIVSVELVSYK